MSDKVCVKVDHSRRFIVTVDAKKFGPLHAKFYTALYQRLGHRKGVNFEWI